MASLNYYHVLELDTEATNEQIKQSYKRLALKHHPDKNQDKQAAKAMFTQISEAYSVLIDSEKRELYDRYGSADINDIDMDFESFFTANFDDFSVFLEETLFSGLSGNFNKFSSKGGKGSSKRNKRAKGTGSAGAMSDLEKMMFGLMREGPSMFPTEKSKKKDQDDDWETDSEDENQDNGGWQDVDEQQEHDEQMDPSQLMMLPVFIQQNSTTTKKGKKKTMSCNIDGEVFKSDEELVQHFCESHQGEFKKWARSQ